MSVHPRAGGEHFGQSPRPRNLSGSSPRGRGTLPGRGVVGQADRFIPARAGNTGLPSGSARPRAVHPRAGGEHSVGSDEKFSSAGSSPRGRGTHGAPETATGIHRFIPARAGNTHKTSSARSMRSVHPRAGGEHVSRPTWRRARSGSSPRGRGTHGTPRRRDRFGRFIPARAGNTTPAGGEARGDTVHPRAGGEHAPGNHQRQESHGSSPRGRGTPARCGRFAPCGRFIPARAGNTPTLIGPYARWAVHPRAGGEHAVAVPHQPQRHRFIPARAGNT